MILEIILGVIFLAIGAGIGLAIAAKTKLLDKFVEKDKDKEKILNDPHALKQKLDSNGPYFEIGDKPVEIYYEVEEVDGVEQLVMKTRPFKKEDLKIHLVQPNISNSEVITPKKD